MNKLPPHSLDAEMGVIGCCLLDPNNSINECIDRLKSDKTMFYDLRHQELFQALSDMFNERRPIDLITFREELKTRNLLNQIGGDTYLMQVQDSVPSAANLPTYLEIVNEKRTLRKLLKTCSDFANQVHSDVNPAELLESAEREILSIRRMEDVKSGNIKVQVGEAISDIEGMFERKGQISGLATGFIDLDRSCDGMHGGESIIIAAYPSVGKTALAINIAEHCAMNLGMPVGVFSCEMSARSLIKRIICSHGRVNLRSVREGNLSEKDFSAIASTAAKVSNSPIFIDDSSDISIGQLRAKARRMVQQHGIKLFVVDYIQLINCDSTENRTNEIDKVSKGLKQMAKEFDVPVIALSQLNDDGKLKGARAIGEDADNVWVLSRKNENPTSGDTEEINLNIVKARNSERGVNVKLIFNKPFTRFENAARIEDRDVPKNMTQSNCFD